MKMVSVDWIYCGYMTLDFKQNFRSLLIFDKALKRVPASFSLEDGQR
jgi:hypothetical protein